MIEGTKKLLLPKVFQEVKFFLIVETNNNNKKT